MRAFDESLLSRLRSARHVVALTGAGISAESGVPTFRDALTGLWSRFDPRVLATPEAFARSPAIVWNWYAERRDKLATVSPNAGHRALARIERLVPEFLLATQNVDGLHARAGSRKLVELHGNIARVKCSREHRVIETWSPAGDGLPPRCPRCGAFLRPDVVWFDETLPEEALSRAEDAAHRCDVLLVVGTSGEVYPAAALPHHAKAGGARVVEINPDDSALSALADDRIRAPAGIALPALVAATWPGASLSD
jgi:NAD-dependent deacetylase